MVRAPGELRMVQEVARRAWDFDDRELPPTADLVATNHVGAWWPGLSRPASCWAS
jgi:hypothetical protein